MLGSMIWMQGGRPGLRRFFERLTVGFQVRGLALKPSGDPKP